MDAVSNIWESVNLQAVYCNKVDSSFKKTLQFSIYSKNDQVPTVTSKIIYLCAFNSYHAKNPDVFNDKHYKLSVFGP